MLDSKAAEKRRAYLQEWRRKNPDKVREYNETYWQRKAEQKKEGKDDAENASAAK